MVASLIIPVFFISLLLAVVGFGVGVIAGGVLWRKNGETARRLQAQNQKLAQECQQLSGGGKA